MSDKLSVAEGGVKEKPQHRLGAVVGARTKLRCGVSLSAGDCFEGHPTPAHLLGDGFCRGSQLPLQRVRCRRCSCERGPHLGRFS